MSSRFSYIILVIVAAVAVAGCVGGSQAQSGSPGGSPQAKWDSNYCYCGLHQSGSAMAEQNCLFLRNACIDEDEDPDSESCQFYKQITDLYKEGTCNPNFSNPEARTLYCAVIMPGLDLEANPWVRQCCVEGDCE